MRLEDPGTPIPVTVATPIPTAVTVAVSVATAITVAATTEVRAAVATVAVPEAGAAIPVLYFVHRTRRFRDGADADLSRGCLDGREQHAGRKQAGRECRYVEQWLTPGPTCQAAMWA